MQFLGILLRSTRLELQLNGAPDWHVLLSQCIALASVSHAKLGRSEWSLLQVTTAMKLALHLGHPSWFSPGVS